MNLKRTLLGALALLLAGGAFQSGLAQTAGTCTGGSATADLDINNVRARMYNNGGLFWKGAGNVYNVPKALPGRPITPNAIFASGIWIGGFVGTELRQAAATYSNWEFYPGPLDNSAAVPGGSCAPYDKIYLVSKEEIRQYLNSGTSTPDLVNWPTGLGAPTFVDVNGNGVFNRGIDTEVTATSRTQKINLSANQLPNISGDQMAWWVMNDVGGPHSRTGSRPIGLEVQVSAFAFNLAGDLGNTTFYRYKLNYKGTQPLTQTFFGIFSDPDLGNASDDYVGADTTLGLGYVYNADNFDEGSDGYGTPPPASGYDFFQGPLVDAPGQTHKDPDGTVYQNKKRLKMTTFVYYNNATANNGDPRGNTDDYYKYMTGRWQDGRAFYACGDGHATTNAACGNARIMFPGDPTKAAGQRFWSEFEPQSSGTITANAPSDRRFALATGPFTINPGDSQTIVYAIVYGRGANNIASVSALKTADALAQSAFDNDFVVPAPPDAPRVSVTSLDRSVILSWSNLPTDNNYLERYDVFSPFTNVTGDRTYSFEGYRVYQYPNAEFNPSEAQLVGNFDLNNGIGRVNEAADLNGEVRTSALGTDGGVQRSIKIDNLTNYRDYYYGVEAYAVNLNTDVSRVYPSTITRVVARPEPTTAAGTVVNTGVFGTSIAGTKGATNGGEGIARALVVNPAQVTPSTYQVRFYSATVTPTGTTTPITVTTYDITNTTTGVKVFDGTDYARRTGQGAPQQPPTVSETSTDLANLVQAEGLAFVVRGPAPGFKNFLTTRNAAGPITPLPEYGALDVNHRGFPRVAGTTNGEDPTAGKMQSTNNSVWGIHTADTDGTDEGWSYFYPRVTRDGARLPMIGASDYEWRFTGTSRAWAAFTDGNQYNVPFELWDVGTKADASDDVRMVPWINPISGGQPYVFDIGADHPTSGGTNDPQTDWVYWMRPTNTTPGQAGYQEVVAAMTSLGANYNGEGIKEEVMARMVLVSFNGGPQLTGPFNATMVEQGTVFRVVTFKPNQIGDTFTINATNAAAASIDVVNNDSARAVVLDNIGISPNPYRGASAYEVSNLVDIARFTGMPARATIRIFTLSGTLIRTLEKNGPERSLDWDLQSEGGLPIASGMYLIHIEASTADGTPIGEKVIKFGVVKKRIQLDIL